MVVLKQSNGISANAALLLIDQIWEKEGDVSMTKMALTILSP